MAKLLYDRGFKKVRPLLGGFDAWKQAGYPINSIIVSTESASGAAEKIS